MEVTTVMRTGIAIVFTAMCGLAASAQTFTVSGVVVDARTRQPLAGVEITLEEHGSTRTDASGQFAFDVPAGEYVLRASLVGYALVRQTVTATANAAELTIALAEGAGNFEEHVTVAATASGESASGPARVSIYGRELQALRGVTLDDPLRALHAVPSAAATDDFYSEFAIRGSSSRHVGLVVDGMPAPYLMHSVHGVTDGGSIAMVNSDAVGNLSLMSGSFSQRIGRALGAEVDLELREGNRERTRARVGLSGTAAAMVAEGPLARGRGSWLVSGRRSYLDMLVKRIDDTGSFAFGFTDAEAKLVFDLTPRHQLQVLAIGGRSAFDEKPDSLGANDPAQSDGRSWLSGVAWRFMPSPRFTITQRLFTTGLRYETSNRDRDILDDSAAHEIGWRTDATAMVRPGLLVQFGGDAESLSRRHAQRRALNDASALTTVGSYDATGAAASAYAQLQLQTSLFAVSPGVRVDRWGSTHALTSSPWITADVPLAPHTRLRFGTGLYRQFPDLETIDGVRGGGRGLRPETAHHLDVGIWHDLPLALTLQVNWYARNERDILWTPGAEPRLRSDGSIELGRGDAPWVNALEGRARGIEGIARRDAPTGLSGWVGYAFGRHRYTDATTGETFWGDVDQRHALSLFGHYRLSNRTTLSSTFRYGSNYPMVGYIGRQAAPANAPPLFGGDRPVFFGLVDARNTLRLPAYARLDVRADRTFTWSTRRVTVFAEVANALNRQNLRNVPYGIDPSGRVSDPTETLLPIVPSAGFVVEF